MGVLATAGQLLAFFVGGGTFGVLVSGEINRRLSARQTRRGQLNRLLSYLLELRNTLVGIALMTKKMTDLFPASEQTVMALIPQVLPMVIDNRKLHERYDSAVDELATLDPFLAYNLRSKNVIETVMNLLPRLTAQDQAAAAMMPQVLKALGDKGKSALEKAIRRVAQELGRKTLAETNKVLEEDTKMSEEVGQFLDFVRAASAKAQTPPPYPPKTGG